MDKPKKFEELNHQTRKMILAIRENQNISILAKSVFDICQRKTIPFAIWFSNLTYIKGHDIKEAVYIIVDHHTNQNVEDFGFYELQALDWDQIVAHLFNR